VRCMLGHVKCLVSVGRGVDDGAGRQRNASFRPVMRGVICSYSKEAYEFSGVARRLRRRPSSAQMLRQCWVRSQRLMSRASSRRAHARQRLYPSTTRAHVTCGACVRAVKASAYA